jgi:hypothetical protein
MANVDWYVEGVAFGACNCVHTCPCQFEGLPTEGGCHGFEVERIDKGHFGETDLGGLKMALFYAWPGPIFEGKGALQAVIDERADAEQRQALLRIAYGEDTDEAATHWWVYRAMSDTVHEPLYRPIEMQVDIDRRRARVSIPDVLEAGGRPITSPVDGGEHRVRIDIPNGIEFELAEIGAASGKATGAIRFDLDGTYGQFNLLRHSGTGVVR